MTAEPTDGDPGRTTKRNYIFRVDPDLHAEAKAIAQARYRRGVGRHLTGEVEAFLSRYVARNRPKEPQA